jgi:Ca2+/Na+ antiporter
MIMENLATTLAGNKLLLAILIGILLLLAFALIKKIVKFILFLVLILALYLGYLLYTGQEIPGNKKETIESIKENSSKLRDTGKKTLKKVPNK